MGFKSDWAENTRTLDEVMQGLSQANPKMANAFFALKNQVFADGAMPAKTKKMVAVALAIAGHCDGCITAHVNASIEAGCTREEFAELVGVAVLMGGGPSFFYGSKAMDAFDTLSGEKAASASA